MVSNRVSLLKPSQDIYHLNCYMSQTEWIKNTAMAGIAAFANEEIRGVFVDEDDVWKYSAKSELGSALSGTLPFLSSITKM